MLRFTTPPARTGLLATLFALVATAAHAGATLYSFGPAAGDTTMARNDDGYMALSWAGIGPAGSTPVLSFFNTSYKSLFVNTNGVVSFNNGVAAWDAGLFPLPSNIPIIAPLWADVDTRLQGSGPGDIQSATRLADPGNVFYRTTQDAALLSAIGANISGSFVGTVNFAPTMAQIVTWDHVAAYGISDTNATTGALRNTFQLVLATDGFRTYSMFLYPNSGVQWLRGSASSTSYPGVGFDAGDGINFYNAPMARVATVVNLPNLTNTVPSSPGKLVYRIDTLSIQASPVVTPNPEGSVVSVEAITHRWVSATGSGNWAAGTTNWVGNSSSPAAIATDTTPAKWTNGDAATFGGTVGTVSITAPIAAERITLETSGYTFTSTLAENSLQLGQLLLPAANATVNFAGNLVVVVDRNQIATNQIGGGYLGAITQGNLVFKDNSVLVGRGASALNGGTITLQGSSQFQLYGDAPTTRAASLVFDRATAGGIGGTFDLRGHHTTIGSLTSVGTAAGVIKNSGTTASTLTTDFDTRSTTFNGVLQDGTSALALVKAGTGTLTLAGANTYTGGTTFAAGNVVLGHAAALGSTGTLSFTGGTLNFSSANTTDYSARLSTAANQAWSFNTAGQSVTFASALTSAGGSLTKLGPGTLTLTAANTYTGTTTVAAGTLIADHHGEIGTFAAGSTVIVRAGATLVTAGSDSLGWGSGNAKLVVDGGTVTTDSSVGQHTSLQDVTMTGGLITSASAQYHFLLNGPLVTLASSTTAVLDAPKLQLLPGWTAGVTTSFTVARGTTADGVDLAIRSHIFGDGPLVLRGPGTLALTGANTYTGGTTVHSGQLDANNLTGSATGTGAVAILSGARLGGSGSIDGLTTLASGATLAPGNSPGTLTFTNGLTLDAGAILDFELGSTSDLIRVSGGTLTGPTTGTVTLNLADAGGFTAASYTLFDFSGATTSSFTASDFSLGTTLSGYTYSLALVGNTLQLTALAATAVPEPSTYALIAGLLTLTVIALRRPRRL